MQQSLFGSLVAVVEKETPSQADLLATPITDAVFTVIDLETTGLNAKKNAITEVTAIQYKNGEEIGKYSTLVKPTEAITDEVIAITGITNEMVQDAPPLISMLTELCSFVGSAPLIVGHNVGFDIKFLQEKLSQAGLGSFSERITLERAFCTKVLAQKALPGLPNYDGVLVATQCGVYNPNPHRAEHDVRMSAGIIFHLIDKLRNQGAPMNTVQDLMDYQGSLQ